MGIISIEIEVKDIITVYVLNYVVVNPSLHDPQEVDEFLRTLHNQFF